MNNISKVVLAYSGGLDTSVILKWLQVEYGYEVVTFTADLGQGEELEPEDGRNSRDQGVEGPACKAQEVARREEEEGLNIMYVTTCLVTHCGVRAYRYIFR